MGCGTQFINGKKEGRMERVYENTARSLGQFSRFINSIFGSNDENIINFCRTEYGTEWQWAYSTWQRERRFPNHLDTFKEVA